MALICYHVSHEQFPPSRLLHLARAAEDAGFDGIHSSDHFHPWSLRQGQSGFSFSWLGAAMHATSLPFSVVCAPGQRYHPAIVAQALATLAEMFPNRIDVELGSGEALNESITGDRWPDKDTRNARLLECADVIRRLWRGDTVSHDGLVTIREARLFTLPSQAPRLLCAALSEKTARWAGTWADGLLTTTDSTGADARRKMQAFSVNGGGDKPVHLQFGFSYARVEQDAITQACEQWRSLFATGGREADLTTPQAFDHAAKDADPQDILQKIPIYTDMEELRETIRQLEDTGAARIVLHNLNLQQEEFIQDYQKRA